MSPGRPSTDGVKKRERFSSGWTGAVAVGLFVYVAIAVALILVDASSRPWLDIFNLYSDSLASIAVAVLTGAAARGSSNPAAQRTWWLLTAALGVYSIGNLLHSTYWLFGVDPFPSIGDVFFLGFYPLVFAAVLTVIRTAAVRVQWARLGLDTAILMLGFGAFFWFFVIAPTADAQRDPDVLKYVLAQAYIALNCLMLLACGVLLMHSGATPIRRRALMLITLGFSSMSLADIVWAMSKVDGSYIPGGVSDVIYLSCYIWLAAAAREQLRGSPRTRRAPHPFSVVLIEGMPYIAMMMSFMVLVYVESSTAASPVNAMTVIIFVLTSLVMLRQGVLSRDDALLRERRAAGIVEARYASLIKHASDVIMITDAEGILQFASPAAERTFATHPDDMVGRNLLDRWIDGDNERLAGFLAEVVATQGRVVGPIELVVETGERRSTLECVGSNLMDDPAIAGLALNFRDVSERKALEEQLRKLAFHDPLTLLANRSLFWNRVEHALTLAQRSQQQVAVMFLDLDNFKNVNDSLGHDAGDRAAAGGGAAAGQVDAALRHRGAPRRRRVRDPARGHPQRSGCRAHRRPDHRGASIGRCWSTAARPTPRRASVSPARSPATTPNSCCARPTSPCTTRRPPARPAACCSSRTCRNSCTTACAWSRTSTWPSCATSSSSSSSRSST